MLIGLLLVASAALATASPATSRSNHVVHEKRDSLPAGWIKQERVDPRAILPLKIGLKQRNLDRAEEFLDLVANPFSSRFSQHWSEKEVIDMFAPSEDTIKAVKSWLESSGIASERIALTRSKTWMNINITVGEAESLLATKYHIYEHSSGLPHVATESYSVPALLSAEHIDIIMPTVHFDAKLIPGRSGSGTPLRKRDTVQPGKAKSIGKATGTLPKPGRLVDPKTIITELENCDTMIVPDCLRALYSFPPGLTAEPGNAYGIAEFTPQAYRPEDLDQFFANFSKKQVGQRPILDSIDGGYPQQTYEGFEYNGESDLDLEYAMTLVYPQKVVLYQVGDLEEGASFNNFLDAIDGSYCIYEGGDDPTQDATYPDPLPGGYPGPQNCGTYKATNVFSVSYGYNEADLTPAYERRQCDEYLKLGLQGVTVLYSSGDSGVAGNGGQCIAADGSYNDGASGRFNPGFPVTCPWVTAVGATEVPPGTNIVVDLATGTQPEIACETVIYSGGGFSNVFPLPAYQAAAVHHYLEAYPPPYGADQYNNSGKVRAFPDVSANGANYLVAIDGEWELVYGTSASSPTFGSVVTLVNEARLAAGKKPVGFINPTLYAHPYVLNDITKGDNPGCGTSGFQSEPGWDPVTGLGTPNFVKLLALYLSLP